MPRPECVDLRIKEKVLLELIRVPSGECLRISMEQDSQKKMSGEEPIKVEHHFLLGKYPLTIAQWIAVMGEHESNANSFQRLFRRRDERSRNCTPYTGVTAEEAASFCVQLSELMNLKFSLPTEDEWEYACRCGGNDPFPVGDPKRYPNRYYGTMRRSREDGYLEAGPLPGTIPPNRFGLLGMQGYIREWCCLRKTVENYDKKPKFTLC
ncbi:MAG: formylglycine-generating enzyme family protein, partial [Planctomycetota bacterium]